MDIDSRHYGLNMPRMTCSPRCRLFFTRTHHPAILILQQHPRYLRAARVFVTDSFRWKCFFVLLTAAMTH